MMKSVGANHERDLSDIAAARYAAEAADYAALWAPALHPVALELVASLPRAEPVLDLGAGVGTLLATLRGGLGDVVVGLDRTYEMISLADPGFGRVVGDARALPFHSGAFGAVVAAFVLFHLSRPEEALREARRLLKPGGAIGAVTWERDSGSKASAIWDEELRRAGADGEEATPSSHELMNSPEKVMALLQGAGFEGIRAWTIHRRDEPDAETLIARKTRLGAARRRLEGLDPGAREACIAAAAERIRGLGPDDLHSEWCFVLAVGHA